MWSNAEIARATRENLPNKEFNQPLTKNSRTHDGDNVHSERRVTRVVRILGRRYPLTDTFYKYLDIGVQIGGSCDVELAIGDSRGNEIKFSMDTWKDLLRKRHNILQIFADTPGTSSEPISINDVTVKLRQLNDVKLAKLSDSTVSMFMSEKTVQKLFAFEYCIDHMYSWLSENLYLVELHNSTKLSKVRKFQYLKSCLSGDAEKMLALTPTTAGKYKGAWTSLERHFASPSELKRLLDDFHQTQEAFTALGKPVDEWDEWFLFLCTEKLDQPTRVAWEVSLTDPLVIPRYETLETFLENRVHALSTALPSEIAATPKPMSSGSECSFLNEWSAQTLRLRRRSVRVELTGYQGTKVGTARSEVSVEFRSPVNKEFRIPLEALVTKSLTAPTPSHPLENGDWEHIKGLLLADSSYNLPGYVDVLLGADICGQLLQDRREGPPGTPTAVLTPFGWTLMGSIRFSEPGWTARVLHVRHQELPDLKRFWEVEEVPVSTPMTSDALRCELQDTTVRDSSGRYIVRLPFRNAPPRVETTRLAALRMLLSAEQRQQRDLVLRQNYVDFMEEYHRLGHMVAATTSLEEEDNGCYIPHYAVWKTMEGQKKHPGDKVTEYRLNTVTYGTAPAPYLAHGVLRQLAYDEENQFPLASQVLHDNTYVDDAEDAWKIQGELINILASAGFPLDKWASSYPKLRASLVAHKVFQDPEVHGALGLKWDTGHDTLAVRGSIVGEVNPNAVWTKRSILSEIARVFDPMGWLTPVFILAKVLLQDLWLAGVTWDESLGPTLAHRWTHFRLDLPLLYRISVPRWTQFSPRGCSVELHGFCDASERAYAAVAYLIVRQDAASTVSLLMTKSRVAPIKTISILRLELCGAVLLVRLLTSLKRGLGWTNVSTQAWSDSTVVLAWIKVHPSRWKPFVAHRVAEIQSEPGICWYHVGTHENPADLATRGISSQDLRHSDLWWSGPSWIINPPDQWPVSSVPEPPTLLPEERQAITTLTITTKEENHYLRRFSNLDHLIRVTAQMRRFQVCARKLATCVPEFLTTLELRETLLIVIRLSQQDSFAKELERLQRGVSVSTSSSIKTLCPFLDKDGILRVEGRLKNTHLAESRCHPAIMSRTSHLATLIIRDGHHKTLHGGVNATTASIHRAFWIPRCRVRVKQILHDRVLCVSQRALTGQQRMGNLPTVRLQPSKPFLRAGVDYAGPFALRTAKERGHKNSLRGEDTALSYSATMPQPSCDRGAHGLLSQLFKASSQFYKTVAEVLANEGTEWTFIPPYSPHMGGLWEAAVKSMKTHLKKTIGEATLTYEEMATLPCRIEACLNSRPLTPLLDEPRDLEPLTPGHFLVSDRLISPPEHPDLVTNTCLKKFLTNGIRSGHHRIIIPVKNLSGHHTCLKKFLTNGIRSGHHQI
ncbi:uncharacterized protein LOC128879935 [Hylaeus volcanicus]|uniref:uncharacterized protein LOC128879935 n=1 Tax=Hylaeus volcanicus TaxID=313075 RepID=UPI0023B7D4B0|nr:uncharacterized protein LOC128879935 [Hylaeus volcanicus]